MSAEEIVAALGLVPHPEGGLYLETWREASPEGRRAAGSAIYFLLQENEVSAWHRIDAAEVWHFYGGGPLELLVSDDGKRISVYRLGLDIAGGERPQVIVPPGAWQRARSMGSWTLVGCTVSPAFEFERFEVAPQDWFPGS